MVKTLTYDNPDHKIKPKSQQFQAMGKSTGQINNTKGTFRCSDNRTKLFLFKVDHFGPRLIGIF